MSDKEIKQVENIPEENTRDAGENTVAKPAKPKAFFALPLLGGDTLSFSLSSGSFRAAVVVAALGLGSLIGAAGFFGYNYYSFYKERSDYNEYKAHKAEQEARIQSLLDDNEKMLRDMSEIHTLETKLRRAVIRNSEDTDFTSNIGKAGAAEGTEKTDPRYMGKGGPSAVDISMVSVLEAQNKNLAHQIDEQKTNMNELISTLEGRNNKRSILPDMWPVQGGVISSYYGGRTGPIEGGYDWHPGLDIAADFGQPIFAAAMGTIEQAGWNGGYGQYVRIDHGNGYESAYGHMSGIAVQAGQAVRKGEIIGFVGSTGYSTGPHVHFEIFVDGQNIDPLYMLKAGEGKN